MDEIVITSPWRDLFTLVREDAVGDFERDSTTGARAASCCDSCAAVYYSQAVWDAETPRQRHLTLARAVTLLRNRRLVVSHRSAAIIWNLPLLGEPPEAVHVVAERTSGGRSDERLVRHCLDIPASTAFIDGLEVTELSRTVVDVARTSRFAEAVMVADAALARGARRDDIARDRSRAGIPRSEACS